MSPKKVTGRNFFGGRPCPRRISCPERNFVTIGSNVSILGMHVSGNDSVSYMLYVIKI